MNYLDNNKSTYIADSIKNFQSDVSDIELSIVVVAYNTNEDLLLCIDSIAKQLTPKVEVLVIDNGKNDAIYDKLIRLPVYYIKLKRNMGACFGRNVGILESRGRVVAFLDDDCVADENFISSLLDIFKNKDIYGLRGKIEFKTETIYNYLQNHYQLGNDVFPYFINVEGVCAVRRREIVEVGGWNEDIWGHEGLELSYRLVRQFGRRGLVYHPSVIIYHDFANSLNKLISKDIRHQKIHKYLYDEQPYLFDFMSYYKNKTFEAPNYKLSMIGRIKLCMLKRLRHEMLIRPTFRGFFLKT